MATVVLHSGCRTLMEDQPYVLCADLAGWASDQLGYWKLLKRKQFFGTFKGQLSLFSPQSTKTPSIFCLPYLQLSLPHAIFH